MSVEPEHRYVGIGTMSGEGTSETDYVWRAAPGTPFPRPRTAGVGEIGWAVPDRQDWDYANTSRQIMVSKGGLSLCVRKPTIWVSTGSNTNQPLQSQKQARSLKFRI